MDKTGVGGYQSGTNVLPGRGYEGAALVALSLIVRPVACFE